MTLVKSFNLLIIVLLAILSAHTELKSSLPDFSGSTDDGLSAVQAESNWNNALPGKGSSLDEQILKTAMTFFILLLSLPAALPFARKFFNQQIRVYRSITIRHFHLLL